MINFPKCFELLTSNPPFTWQIRLYERFLANKIPEACDIPTGLGKTSVIAIWLLALATKLIENPQENKIPRRLVYVVDRRVIVDQATKEAEDILSKLIELNGSKNQLIEPNGSENQISQIYNVFRDNSFLDKDDSKIIALSTLRGEFADNREWCLDPSRPAIIVGTIDMIGSRLLFSAYGGVGESYKAVEDGLLGQDSLIVVDEAHLSHAFVEMLKSLPKLVYSKKIIKPFKVMQLSATLDIENDDPSKYFSLEKDAREDLTNEVTSSRLNAEKRIEWKSFTVSENEEKQAKKEKKSPYYFQAKKMVENAICYKDSVVSVLLFGKQVDLVKEIKRQLIEQIEESQVLLMVGGMRGFERNQLIDNPIFKMFDPNRERIRQNKSYFLVATSCAEVGVNLDADFAVCDLTSANSFIQRLGRINRFGETSAVVTIVYNENSEHESKEAIETHKTLKEFEIGENLNATPLKLREIKFPENCNPPKPVCPPLDSARIDDWSMTSLKQDEFRRPLVSYWLRGVTDNKTSETSLCWRSDLQIISESEALTGDRRKDELINRRIEKKMITSVKTVRVKSRECVREATHRAVNFIQNIAKEFHEHRVVIISSANEYEVYFLKELKENTDLYKKLIFSTVVFPCAIGGLENGILTINNLEIADDVLEMPEKKIFDKNVKERDREELDETSFKTEWLRIILTKENGIVSVNPLSQKVNPFEHRKFENFKTAIKEIAKSENRKEAGIIDLGNFVENDDEEETQKKRKISYLILKKSPEAYLPNEAENDNESEISSIGFPKSISNKTKDEISLEKHNQDVAEHVERLANKLCLNTEFVEALKNAGAWHDKGKARKCWQNAVGNFDFPDKVLAKSNQAWFGHKYNNYYRHEFGSLVEAEEDNDLNEHVNRDLILHLIATHHGYSRPHFPERAFDQENPHGLNRETAERAMLRFANLQIKYGWWQLAYLEAILKAADALASRAEARGEI